MLTKYSSFILLIALAGCSTQQPRMDDAVMRACAEQSHQLGANVPKSEAWNLYLECVDRGLMRLGYPPISTAIGP